MKEAEYIDRNIKIDESVDFHYLRNRGIKKIQELTGAYWTDYNLHDPGVTILEQLCYALTDLSYRTNINIENHLFSGSKKDLPFFKPESILSNKSVTIHDYRKLFLDSIQELNNVWIEPVDEKECGFNGLYRILIDVSAFGIDSFTSNEEITQKIKAVFTANRNIGEDIYEITILEELPIIVHADIETDGIHDLELIMAKVYFTIEQLLNPSIKFHSLSELLENGFSYDEIFDGPFLKHGFILSEELQSKQNSALISDIIRAVMEIEGVVSVKQLVLEIEGKKISSQINIPTHLIARVITSGSNKAMDINISNINFYKGNLKYTSIDNNAFKRLLNKLVSENKKAYRIQEETFKIPEIYTDFDVEEYYSIQNHFPAIYGLGPEGLPGNKTTENLSKVKQLKAFLAIFEQFMANYLSQLNHFKDLFSIRKKQEQTYYYQPITMIPHIEEILMQEIGFIDDVYIELKEIPKNYYEAIPKINALFDSFFDRKNRFLDFQLAIHGETFMLHTLNNFNAYLNDSEYENFLIRCKTALLQSLGELNSQRASGSNYLSKNAKVEYSGLEKRIAINFGFGLSVDEENIISVVKPKSCFECFYNSKQELISAKKRSANYKNWLSEGDPVSKNIELITIENNFEYIDDFDFENADWNIESSGHLLEAFLPFKQKKIFTDFLVNGLSLMRYKIGSLSNDNYLVSYQNSPEEWLIIAEFSSKNEAILGVKGLIQHISNTNIQSECMHSVEHILLRPKDTYSMFGIYIKDKDGNNILKSQKRYTLKERNDILEILEKNFENYNHYTVEVDEKRDMSIRFYIPDHDLVFTSIDHNISVEETHDQKEKLYSFLADKESKNEFMSKIGYYIQYDDNSIHIPEKFFSFQMSILFPNWTARFKNEEFRRSVYDTVIEKKPAIVLSNVHWLSPEEMLDFELLFLKWNDLLHEESADQKNELNTVCAQIASFLYLKNKEDIY